MSSGSSPKSWEEPAGSTSSTPLVLRPYPRERMSNFTPRARNNSPRRRTNGVFPEPPTDKLPILTTGTAKIIVLSAIGREVLDEIRGDPRVAAVVAKPFSLEGLLALVETVAVGD